MKSDINPMQRAPRCAAHSRRSGLPCQAPAVTGWGVCRMHGAGGGAPRGKRNGSYRHGQRTTEAMSLKAAISALVRESRRLMSSIE